MYQKLVFSRQYNAWGSFINLQLVFSGKIKNMHGQFNLLVCHGCQAGTRLLSQATLPQYHNLLHIYIQERKKKKKIKRLHQYYLKKMKSSLYMYKILTKNKFLYYSIKYFFFSKYHIFAYQEEQQKHQLDEPFQPFFRAYLIQSTLLPLHGQISESKS